ncbi:phytochrome [Genlisea aurea]|uniref:Phytochrome n=1 Tax=Genlisea aurea TaxID=192259 RepID=S8BZP8_9LAMI|nr:phytochrome [Genlisea aurea]
MSSQPAHSSSSSSVSRHSARILAQTSLDAKLHADFEESGSSFDYFSSIRLSEASSGGEKLPKADRVTSAYLHQMQRSKSIQPFGCLLALDERTFRVIAYSENAPEMLTMVSHAVPSVGDHRVLDMDSDIRTIFTAPSTASLQKAFGFSEVSLLNPILVHCKTSGKPFYAIIHRVTGSLILDFEPVMPLEVPVSAAGALQSYKLAAKAIARLQSLPGGSMERLCDAMAREVFELTGYDRVMIYKFHDDDHGEVIAEVTNPGLESYLSLHFPATDIPQAARFLFMKNKVRMICDCRASHVKVVQDKKLSFDLTLCGSTLRAPHSCHLQYMENMNSIASLVMAVVVNDGEEAGRSDSVHQEKKKRLWGLVVCHHTAPRFVPFPLRYACEFLAQVFAVHVAKEMELDNQMVEKNILRTQTLLCEMLLRDAPLGILSQSPNVMDLVKCDGAALLYKNKHYKVGVTPTDYQIQDIVAWLDVYHTDSTGFSTESLYDAGFPGALAVGDKVCGMVAVKVTNKDWLFWFRSHTASDIRWGGAKHNPDEKDDVAKMHPRSSFQAFLEVVKKRSLPWKDYEMDAIHSLQLIMRKAFEEAGDKDRATNTIQSSLNALQIEGIREIEAVTSEMVRLIETASVPIFAVDVDGIVNGWNTKISHLTSLPVDQAVGKHFVELVEDSFASTVNSMLAEALRGNEEQNVQFEIKTHGEKIESGPISLIVNACASRDVKDNVVGVCFIAQDVTAQKTMTDKFTKIEGDYQTIIQNPNPLIPPIFGTDEFGWCTEWNAAMANISGWPRDEVINKMLLGEVFGINDACCRLKNNETYLYLGIVLNNAVSGQGTEKASFGFFSRSGKYVECLLSVIKRIDGEESVTGVFCFLQIASQELQQALHLQGLSERKALKRLKILSYMRREIRNPLSGIAFSRKMLEGTELDERQKNLLRMSLNCQNQLSRVLDDADLDRVIEGYIDLDMAEFTLHDALIASISQVVAAGNERGVAVSNNVAQNLSRESLFGDVSRLQQVMAAFLAASVAHTPSGGQVSVSANLYRDAIGTSVHLARLELRITHSGGGVAQHVLNGMFGEEEEAVETEDEISLFISRKLVKHMNGDVKYLKEAGKAAFIVTVEVAMAKKK